MTPDTQTEQITCYKIPLYKFSIYYENDEKPSESYDFVIIADTLEGLAQGIAKRELAWTMKDCRKYLSVTDFLMMPCPQAQKGFHLFDIDEHDLMGHCVTIDETFYECFFADDTFLKPVTGFSEILAELTKDKEEEEVKFMHWISVEGAMGDVLYASEMVREAVLDESFLSSKRDREEQELAANIIQVLMARTG
jgi:hypothetical protein